MPERSQFALVSGLCVDVGERIDEFAIMDMESERLFFYYFHTDKKGQPGDSAYVSKRLQRCCRLTFSEVYVNSYWRAQILFANNDPTSTF